MAPPLYIIHVYVLFYPTDKATEANGAAVIDVTMENGKAELGANGEVPAEANGKLSEETKDKTKEEKTDEYERKVGVFELVSRVIK